MTITKRNTIRPTRRGLAGATLAAVLTAATLIGVAGAAPPENVTPPSTDAPVESTVPDVTEPVGSDPPPGSIPTGTTSDDATTTTAPPPVEPAPSTTIAAPSPDDEQTASGPEPAAPALDIAAADISLALPPPPVPLPPLPPIPLPDLGFDDSSTFVEVVPFTPTVYGTAVQFRATVTDESTPCDIGFCENPDGGVEFYVDGVLQGARELLHNVGSAGSRTDPIEMQLDAGSHSFAARYVNGNFNPSTDVRSVTVAKANCTATLSGGDTSVEGANWAFITKVVSNTPSGATEEGTLTMRLGDRTALRTIAPSRGSGLVGITNMPVGVNMVHFEYSDANHDQCYSNGVIHTVVAKADAVDDFASTIGDAEVTIDVLGNDRGDSIQLLEWNDPEHGTLTHLPETDALTYKPNPGFVGTDSFTYLIASRYDDNNADTAAVFIEVLEPLVAVDDSVSTPMNTSVTFDPLTNDTRAGSWGAYVTVEPQHGTLDWGAEVVYTPDDGFVGTDTFDYVLEEFYRPSVSARVTITVTAPSPPPTTTTTTTMPPTTTSTTTTTTAPTTAPPASSTTTSTAPAGNDAPIVVGDSYRVTTGQALVVDDPGVLANDIDPAGRGLVAAAGSEPAHGTVVLEPDGSFTYTPDAGYVGSDSFTYTARRGASAAIGFAPAQAALPGAVSEPAVVTISVTPAPSATPTGILPATR